MIIAVMIDDDDDDGGGVGSDGVVFIEKRDR